ncbi:MAG: PH domain-containing protein [Patescibacteria group bacterium]
MGEVELEPGEKVTKAVRKHWFVLLIELLPLIVLAWLPTLFVPFLLFVTKAIQHADQVAALSLAFSPLGRMVYGLWLVMLWSAAFNTLTRWYLNEWIITTNRIIEIHQYGYFSREVSSLLLIRIQDVNTNVDGLFGTLLGYGQLEVQSAGTEEHFIMEDAPDPAGLRDLIMREITALHGTGGAVVGGVSVTNL